MAQIFSFCTLIDAIAKTKTIIIFFFFNCTIIQFLVLSHFQWKPNLRGFSFPSLTFLMPFSARIELGTKGCRLLVWNHIPIFIHSEQTRFSLTLTISPKTFLSSIYIYLKESSQVTQNALATYLTFPHRK